MNTGLMAFVEFFVVLLLVVIIYNAYKKNNTELSLHLNIVILFVAVLKLLYLIYLSMNNISLCQMAQILYCPSN
jgi:predicted branched-subunit amino acid permease